MSATGADIKALVAIVQFAQREVQVADATAGRVSLTGNLTVVLEEIMQRLYHIFKVGAGAAGGRADALHTGARKVRARWGQHAGDMIIAQIAPGGRKIPIGRSLMICMLIAQSKMLPRSKNFAICITNYSVIAGKLQAR